MRASATPHILVAGGGVAGLETCLALRAFLDAEQLSIDLLCRQSRFEYRPLTVLEPFAGTPAWSMALERFAADQDVGLLRDALAAVKPDSRAALTAYSHPVHYDALVVCVGARPLPALRGAINFRGERDAVGVGAALDAIRPGERATVAFAVPGGAFWTLPLYELAILAAARLRLRGTRAQVVLTSPEAAPLDAFGPQASAAVGNVLIERGVEFIPGVLPLSGDAGELALDDGQRIEAAVIVTLPRLVGRRIPGLAQDDRGFLAVDEHQRVLGAEDIYAAGDVTSFPLKQGGLAAQQADAAAEAILAALGVPVVARPFEPVLKGVLYTDAEPLYLRAPAGGAAPAPRAYSMWWPPSKIAGRHLGPYLAAQAGAPRAPEVRPHSDGLAVSIDALSGRL
jgi:sulfide:quinone oxidoreductase